MPAGRGSPEPAWAHRLAVSLSVATLMLILLGGLVTNTGAALAVPDWPTTFGYNMFLYPPSKMVGGIFYEHSHRLLGAVVGLLTAGLAVALFLSERRRWLRGLGLTALGAVCLQGLLGGLRVVLLQDVLAIFHGCLAQAFFALTVALAVCTSRAWTAAPAPVPSADAVLLRRLALATTGVVYLQIVFGALLTHFGTRLDGHLAAALALTLLIPALAVGMVRGRSARSGQGGPALTLLGLLILQIMLGLGAYVSRFTSVPLPLAPYTVLAFPVAHRLTAGLLLATSLVATLRAYRYLAPPTRLAIREFRSREAVA